ncbi:MAG: glycosyltransferase family 39 protein [Anaerolineae bacterium]|nr:glycosyltransferase family 39 protein [Anaerolineae bacterium]
MSRTNRGGLSLLPQVWINITLVIVVLIVSLQLAPSVIEQRRDSGIFAYTGQVILKGGLPYRDAWDNKLPGVYYIDALAFVLFGPNRWALWLIEMICVFFAARLMFWLLDRVYGRWLAWVGALTLAAMARNPALVSDVNFTEVYALLPQVAVFAAGFQFFRRQTWRWAFVVGLSAGVAFLFKQTTMGAALAVIPALALARHPVIGDPRRWKWLAAAILGGLSSLGVAGVYLLANGILDDAIKATFISPAVFHRWVSGDPAPIWATVWQTLTESVVPVVAGPLLPFLLVGLYVPIRSVVARAAVAQRFRLEWPANERTLAVWAAISFLVDLVLSNITQRAYEHYYVILLPSLTILLALSLDVIRRTFPDPSRRQRLALAGMWFYLTLAVMAAPLAGTLFRLWLVNWDVTGPARQDTLSDYVIAHTTPEDPVLVWGATTAINFQSQRLSPVPYHYGYPLIVPDETTPELIARTVVDMERNPPKLIIDTTMTDGDRIPPLDRERRAQWWQTGGRRDVADLTLVYRWVQLRCSFVEEIDQAAIYRCG